MRSWRWRCSRPSASAAVIEIHEIFCGCDGSSGDEDTRELIVTAAPGELNRISVHKEPGGVVVEDLGAPLTGALRAGEPRKAHLPRPVHRHRA